MLLKLVCGVPYCVGVVQKQKQCGGRDKENVAGGGGGGEGKKEENLKTST